MTRATGVPKLNSIGIKFEIDCGEDVSAATITRLEFLKPDGTVVVKDAIIEDFTYLTYTTVLAVDGTTLLDQVGLWRVTAYVEMPGFFGYGEACELLS